MTCSAKTVTPLPAKGGVILYTIICTKAQHEHHSKTPGEGGGDFDTPGYPCVLILPTTTSDTVFLKHWSLWWWSRRDLLFSCLVFSTK